MNVFITSLVAATVVIWVVFFSRFLVQYRVGWLCWTRRQGLVFPLIARELKKALPKDNSCQLIFQGEYLVLRGLAKPWIADWNWRCLLAFVGVLARISLLVQSARVKRLALQGQFLGLRRLASAIFQAETTR
jgi:hypothetical protein